MILHGLCKINTKSIDFFISKIPYDVPLYEMLHFWMTIFSLITTSTFDSFDKGSKTLVLTSVLTVTGIDSIAQILKDNVNEAFKLDVSGKTLTIDFEKLVSKNNSKHDNQINNRKINVEKFVEYVRKNDALPNISDFIIESNGTPNEQTVHMVNIEPTSTVLDCKVKPVLLSIMSYSPIFSSVGCLFVDNKLVRTTKVTLDATYIKIKFS